MESDERSTSRGPGRRGARRWRHQLRRWRRRIKYGRHTRRVTRVALWSLGGLVVLGVAWLLVTGLLARRELEHVRDRVETVRTLIASGQVNKARQQAATIPAAARRAHDYTTGPAWAVAAAVPYFGDPVQVVRGTTEAAAEVGGEVIPALVRVSTSIDPNTLRTSGDTIRIDRLTAAAPRLDAADAALQHALRIMRGVPQKSWFPQLDGQRATFESQLVVVDGYVSAASRVARTLPAMLGADGTQRYFVALQNNAELRGTGGLPGAFAILQADHGRFRFTHFESDAALAPLRTNGNLDTGLDLGRDYDALYGAAQPTSQFSDSNASPDFPYAARIWARMWEKVSGEHITGAIALDPTALAGFLGATGPATLPSGALVSADNVVSLTERDAYQLYPDITRRRAFLVSVLKATARHVVAGAGDGVGLVNAATAASKQRRLLVWSSVPGLERALAETNFAGILPPPRHPLSAPILNNAAGGKLDYYLTRSLDYVRTGCGRSRDVRATLTLANTAPSAGLPPYVTTRIDRAPEGARAGDNHQILDYYATGGALLRSVTVNGKPATAAVLRDEHGHAVFRLDLQLPQGSTTVVSLHLQEPKGSGAPVIWRQPGVTAMAVRPINQSCG